MLPSPPSGRSDAQRRAGGAIGRLAFVLIALFAVLVASPAMADDLQPVPALSGRVVDQTATLDATQKQALEDRLEQFEQRKGTQIAVLLVASTKPEEIEQYSIRVVDAWKIGRRNVDDGVLLLVAKGDRRVRIEVGRGLEGAIPDVIADRIIREYITPKFRDGDFYGGIDDAVGAMIKLIDGEALPPPLAPEPKPQRRSVDSIFNAFIFAIIVALWLRSVLRAVPGVPRAGINGAVSGGLAWYLTGLLPVAAGAGVLGALIAVLGGGGGGGFARRGGWGGWGGGFGGGGLGGSIGGGGGFSGGGGGFSGGGASGSW